MGGDELHGEIIGGPEGGAVEDVVAGPNCGFGFGRVNCAGRREGNSRGEEGMIDFD